MISDIHHRAIAALDLDRLLQLSLGISGDVEWTKGSATLSESSMARKTRLPFKLFKGLKWPLSGVKSVAFQNKKEEGHGRNQRQNTDGKDPGL